MLIVKEFYDKPSMTVRPPNRNPVVEKKIYADGESIKEMPLLTIELENETSVPKVFYEGKEITHKIRVSFDWETSDTFGPGGTKFNIEHIEIIDKQPIQKGVGLARGKYGHATS